MTILDSEIKGCGNRRKAHSIVGSSTVRPSNKSFLIARPVDFYPFDAEYVRRLCAGESEVQEHFSLYFAERLQLKLRHARYHAADIDDIIQDTFVRALEKICSNGLRQPESLGAFMVAICKYVCWEWGRRPKPEQLHDEFTEYLRGSDNPERDALEAERNRAIWAAVGQMEERDRKLLVAYWFDERPKAEICKEFDVTPGYLRVLLFRAKKVLKRRYLKKIDQKRKPNDDEKDH